jgi:hypothetical protein
MKHKARWLALALVVGYFLAVELFALLTAGGGLVTPSGPSGEVFLVGLLVLGQRLTFLFVGLPVLAGWLALRLLTRASSWRARAGRTPRQ